MQRLVKFIKSLFIHNCRTPTSPQGKSIIIQDTVPCRTLISPWISCRPLFENRRLSFVSSMKNLERSGMHRKFTTSINNIECEGGQVPLLYIRALLKNVYITNMVRFSYVPTHKLFSDLSIVSYTVVAFSSHPISYPRQLLSITWTRHSWWRWWASLSPFWRRPSVTSERRTSPTTGNTPGYGRVRYVKRSISDTVDQGHNGINRGIKRYLKSLYSD